jgi:polygalacturonase
MMGTRLLCCLLLWSSAGEAAGKPEIIPPLPGEFLKNIPYKEYIDFKAPIPTVAIFDIRDYGAVGDGRTVNTNAFNAAVRAAHAKGGGVVLIQGGDFVSGTVKLESNIRLHIARDGILRASRDSADYAPFALLLCEKTDNVVIEGPGRILGEGEAWWKSSRKFAPAVPPDTFILKEAEAMHFDAKRGKLSKRPSPFIQLLESSDLTIRNLIIENSPGWTLLLDHCDRVQIKGVVISNNYHGSNTDGIDVVASNDVDIKHCFVATGDDAIVLKNGFSQNKNRAMANIRVSDCTIMSSTNCFKIGTGTSNDISDVWVSDCTFFVEGVWPWSLSGIAIESVDGAHVSRVNVRNISMRNIMTPIFIRLGNRNQSKSKDMQGVLKDVSISNVRATGAEFPCILSGIPGLYINDVTLVNIDIAYREAKEQLDIMDPVPEKEDGYPEFWLFGDLPAYGLWARHVDGLKVKNFKVIPRSTNTREKVVLHDVLNLHIPR